MTTTNTTDTERRLNCDAVDMKPVNVDDWSALLRKGNAARRAGGYGWRAYEAFVCDGCGRTVVTSVLGDKTHREREPSFTVENADGDDETINNLCTAYFNFEGPAMNYWYPVKLDDCEEAARLIAHLPLCVVESPDGDTGLALTGGGMDLSWEICEAFLALGFWPPLHFAELPAMGRRGTSGKDRDLVEVCMESCCIAEGWARRKRERLAAMLKEAP